jgi:hypothetical protein
MMMTSTSYPSRLCRDGIDRRGHASGHQRAVAEGKAYRFVGFRPARGAVDDVLDAIIVPFPVNGVLGTIVYADYRNIVRPALQEYPMREPEGMMEVKEHGITSSVSSMIGPRTFADPRYMVEPHRSFWTTASTDFKVKSQNRRQA